jgi:hypothetical protein
MKKNVKRSKRGQQERKRGSQERKDRGNHGGNNFSITSLSTRGNTKNSSFATSSFAQSSIANDLGETDDSDGTFGPRVSTPMSGRPEMISRPASRGQRRNATFGETDILNIDKALDNLRTLSKDASGHTYHGDIFSSHGNYESGILYRSRMAPASETGDQFNTEGQGAISMDAKPLKNAASSRKNKSMVSVTSILGSNSFSQKANKEFKNAESLKIHPAGHHGNSDDDSDLEDSDDETSLTESVDNQQQHRCASTLRNWSFHKSNAVGLVNEGAVHALTKLSQSNERRTRSCCATALKNLSSYPELREKMIRDGAITAVLDLATHAIDGGKHEQTPIQSKNRFLNSMTKMDTLMRYVLNPHKRATWH